MANSNVVFHDKNGNELYPVTLAGNVSGLGTTIGGMINSANIISSLGYTPANNSLVNVTNTLTTGNFEFNSSGTSGVLNASNVIGTKGYWRLVTIWGEEASQNGVIRLHISTATGVVGTEVASATGESGNWAKQYLCVSALVPPNYYVYATGEKMNSKKYAEQRMGG